MVHWGIYLNDILNVKSFLVLRFLFINCYVVYLMLKIYLNFVLRRVPVIFVFKSK